MDELHYLYAVCLGQSVVACRGDGGYVVLNLQKQDWYEPDITGKQQDTAQNQLFRAAQL